jgi:TRAP-type C4-dicarboxylate transport system permease small subunit
MVGVVMVGVVMVGVVMVGVVMLNVVAPWFLHKGLNWREKSFKITRHWGQPY